MDIAVKLIMAKVENLQYRITFLLFIILCSKLISAQTYHDPDGSVAQWINKMFNPNQTADFLPEFDDSYGVVFRDLNNDQLADLYVVRFRNLNRLFINQGPKKPFADFTIDSELGGNLMPRGKQNLELGASAADVDNNGWPDILLTGWGVTSTLFFQNKNLQFRPKILNDIFDLQKLDANAGIWSDINKDGNLDLFITDEHNHNHILINKGFGKFEINDNNFGIDSTYSTSQGATFADVDEDGFSDLYVCNWFAPDFFFKNINGKYFKQIQVPISHLIDSLNSNSASFGDIDNDGDLDLIVADREGKSRLYRNDIVPGDTSWTFSDISHEAGIDNSLPAYGSIIADLNNDGWPDIFFTNIGPNLFYLNKGNGKFYQAYKDPFPFVSMKEKYSTGSAIADYDNDGDLDLFVSNKDTNSVFYINPLNNQNFIRLQLRGVKSNWDAIGSKVWLYEQIGNDSLELCGYREISGGSSYLSFCEPTVHFGIANDNLYQIVIEFPSNKKIVKRNLEKGRVYLIEELGGFQRVAILSYRWAAFTIATEDFWINTFLFFFMVILVGGFIYFSNVRYGWKNKQIIWFLISILVVLYILFAVQTGAKFLIIILSQLGALSILIITTTVFMEKIRRLEIQRYGPRKLLQDFTHKLIFIKDNKELFEQLNSTVHIAMNTQFCSILEIREMTVHQTSFSGKASKQNLQFDPSKELKQSLTEYSIITSDELNQLIPESKNQQIDVAIPISRNNKLYALLILGKSVNKREYLSEDLNVLRILASQAAIAIENNIYIEETKNLIKKVTEAEVQKKYVKELEEKNQSLQNLYRTLQETQSQLIQSEKMAGLGQLVAGVAHELNNPISFIYANMKELENYINAIEKILQLILSNMNKPHLQEELQRTISQLEKKYDLEFIQKDIHSLINESVEGGRRVKEVVQNLRNFSRLDEGEIKSVDLHEGLNSTLLLLNNEIKNRIEVIKEYGKLPKIECHPGHINQVFMNILINAIQAINGAGKIWISTKILDDQVEILIKDSGKGIPQNIKNKVFDPFFTTKPVGKGTGLGLSISYNIIKNHNGEIYVESEENKGTTFHIKLPVKMKKGKSVN